MKLLDEEVKTEAEDSKNKKIILFLLVLSCILLIAIIVIMMLIPKEKVKPLTMSINGTNVKIDQGLLIKDENGVDYISIQKISKILGYEYLTGEYKQYSEDTTNTKFYLENSKQVIQFEANKNKVYKINPNLNLDYEEYTIKNKILKQNDLLYIALEDINVAMSVIYEYLIDDNKIILKSTEALYKEYKESLATQTNNTIIDISEDFDNIKSIAYNMLVVSNESGKWGVINRKDFSTIIGNKYSTIRFIEKANVFIVSDKNKFGIVNEKGVIVELIYEEIDVINNNPLYYKVKLAGEYGVIDSEGKIIINNLYEKIGYDAQNTIEESVLVIQTMEDETKKTNMLVVCKEGKYGLVNLDDGTAVGECILDKIYSKIENGKKQYYIQLKEQEILLDKYLEYINTTTVPMN